MVLPLIVTSSKSTPSLPSVSVPSFCQSSSPLFRSTRPTWRAFRVAALAVLEQHRGASVLGGVRRRPADFPAEFYRPLGLGAVRGISDDLVDIALHEILAGHPHTHDIGVLGDFRHADLASVLAWAPREDPPSSLPSSSLPPHAERNTEPPTTRAAIATRPERCNIDVSRFPRLRGPCTFPCMPGPLTG